MAGSPMLFRFQIEVSDIDGGLYEPADFRVAQHPSEAAPYLLTRVIAFALNVQEGLEFAPGGLSDSDTPCLRVPGPQGGVSVWIEVGNPSARKLHKASKAAKSVKVYTYKNAELLAEEIRGGDVHRANEIEIYALDSNFLQRLAGHLDRDNRWSLLHQQGNLVIDVGGTTETGELRRVTL